ncbi:hypothetical protein BDQ17DRAFT_1430791 [Cyathus striatus]|nr:hypothetical protein BDQ17DRAFT_1430791 [Cyathus striatus]
MEQPDTGPWKPHQYLTSLSRNGTTSSEVIPLTSESFMKPSVLPLASEMSILHPQVPLSFREGSKLMVNGSPPGSTHSTPLSKLFPIARKNWKDMEPIFPNYSQAPLPEEHDASLPLTKQLETTLPLKVMHDSVTLNNSKKSKQLSSILTGSTIMSRNSRCNRFRKLARAERSHPKPAENLIPLSDADIGETNVTISTSVSSAIGQAMVWPVADLENNPNEEDVVSRTFGSSPSYLRHFQNFSPSFSLTPVLSYSFRAVPFSHPPKEFLKNPLICSVMKKYVHLFKIITPINVNVFEHYLVHHPNHEFTATICEGLRSGFWPEASYCIGYPALWDDSDKHPPQSEAEKAFLLQQRDKEVHFECFSPVFDPPLPQGMISMPIHAVPKGESLFRMITNQSAGENALNSLISHKSVEGCCPLDSLHHLGDTLLRLKRKYGHLRDLLLFKFDVKSAYRLIPMHPLWQCMQVVTMPDGTLYIDRNNVFGGRESGPLWTSFMSLVDWIATFIKFIPDLCIYSDDVFGAAVANDVTWYEPYQMFMPTLQTRLLNLWDELGIPHECEKQVYGSTLTIIGFSVDANRLSISMPSEKKCELIEHISSFIAPQHIKHSLREFQQLAGWINWSLNVHPLLRPGLAALYQKMAGVDSPNTRIYVNNDV